MSDYQANVNKYDSGADPEIVQKIVKHLGIALRRRDSSLVSCSDPKELARVVEKWCGKKLGVDSDKGSSVVEKVCATMKGDRAKCRVAFYYLCAKELGMLGDL